MPANEALNAEDLALITEAARAAGDMALRYKAKGLITEYKKGNSPVTDADLAVDALLKDTLLAARPDYGWLSEETVDDPARMDCERLFVVDPIDGTRAYIRGRPWWVVAIGVVDRGEAVAGVVHAPDLADTYSAVTGGGARLNGLPMQPSAQAEIADCAMIGDAGFFSHPAWPEPWPAMRLASRNATALRMCLVGAGEFDATVTLAPKADWDVAAADLIAREAGAVVLDHKGGRFAYNRADARQLSLVCAGPALAPLILSRTAPIDLPRSTP
ncbi:MAG: 3'(2'),5'-bisphosphate nucleotidase CysQ [Caulobacteraceae bacterium]